jgi:hypothetical protein
MGAGANGEGPGSRRPPPAPPSRSVTGIFLCVWFARQDGCPSPHTASRFLETNNGVYLLASMADAGFRP